MTDSDDTTLLARVAAGDRAAFGALVERHGPSLRRLARLLTPSDDAADEALQAALIGGFQGAASYGGRSSAKAWLFTIVRNAAWHERQRRKSVESRLVDDLPLDRLGVAAGWGSSDPERAAIRAEDVRRLRAAMDELGDQDRELIVLRDIEQLSGEEVARMLGIEVRAMKSRLHRARLRLAAALRAGEDDGRE